MAALHTTVELESHKRDDSAIYLKNKKAPDQANTTTVTEVHSDSDLAVATSCFFAAVDNVFLQGC